MRKNKTVVLGAAALCVGMLGFAGCNNQVMGKRNYVPATDTAVAPMPDAGTTTPQALPAAPVKPAPVKPTPATPATQKGSSYSPMAPVASAPVTSVASSSAGSASGKDGAASAGSTYTVKSGDSIGKIAHLHGVSVSALMQANDLDEAKARRIQVGRKLTIPGASGKAAHAVGKSAAGKESGKETGKAAAVKGAANADGTYTVQTGDSVGKISRKLGVKEADLMKANNLTAESAKRLQVGQKLAVPGKGAAASKAAPSKSTAPAAPGAPATQEKDALDDVLIDSEVKAPAATPATAAVPNAGVAGKTGTALVEEKVVLPALSSVPAIVEADTTLTDFAAKHNVSADKVRELNPGLIPADGKLTKDLLLMIPGN